MTTEWSLDELYKGFDDPAYGKDVAELTAQIDALTTPPFFFCSLCVTHH